MNIPFKIVLGILTFVPYCLFIILVADVDVSFLSETQQSHFYRLESYIFYWAFVLALGYAVLLLLMPHLKKDTKVFWLFLFTIASFISIPVFYFVNVLKVKD
jgi:cbb3-type cytochrome oxidase subunit 1